MKFDNGLPFGDPAREFVPALALWLEGLGVSVTWNRPRTPQDNAKVERMQGLTARWSQAAKCAGIEPLRQGLREACRFQREQYPTRVLGGMTRAGAFPELARVRRPYSPERFDLGRVKQFLAKGMWERKVSEVGQVDFLNQKFSLGRANKGTLAYATYLPDTHQWSFQDRKGKTMRLFPAQFTAESIIDMTAFQSKRVP